MTLDMTCRESVRNYILERISIPGPEDEIEDTLLPSEVDRAYLAGLMDGEGSVSLAKTSNPKGFRNPTLTVTSTDIELVEKSKEVLGGYITRK